MTSRIDISYKTIVFITVFLLALWILFLIRDIILLLFVAFILMSALSPLVKRLVRWHIPRVVAIFLIFIFIVGSIAGVVTVGFTPLINQTSHLSQQLANTTSYLLQLNYVDQSVVQDQVTNLSHQAISFILNLFENFISFVTVIVITFYLLLDKEQIEKRVTSLFIGKQTQAERLLKTIEYKLGGWLRGQVLLSLIVAILTYLGLTLLGVSYALPLALIAGILEIVPVIGPVISAIPGIIIGLTVSPIFALMIAAVYLGIQQSESHIIVPQVMKRAVGLNPLLVIIAITIGGRLLGIGGALLAVPIAVVVQIVLQEILSPGENNFSA